MLLFASKKKAQIYDFTLGLLPSAATFARASAGTRTNAAGGIENLTSNTPRFDCNPATLTMRGLLVEKQSTNKSLYSGAIGGTGWAGNASATANAASAPDGTATAYKFTDNTSANSYGKYCTAAISITSGSVTTVSCYMKAGTGRYGLLDWGNGGNSIYACVAVDLSNGSVVSTATGGGASLSAYGVQQCADGWYRVWLSCVLSSATGAYINVNMTNASGAISYSGDGSNIYVWGTQVETGSVMTSYIPTTSAAATRAVDLLTLTIPAAVSTLRFTFDDGSTQDVGVSAGSYTVPATLNRPWIARIRQMA